MTTNRRVFVLVLDSLGVGELPDAADFGDEGSHTLDHIVQANSALEIPRLVELGLGHIKGVESLSRDGQVNGAFGRMAESSPGKDTSTGHWEMMGCPLTEPFPVFPNGFSDEIIAPFLERAELDGILCNEPASGTEVLERLGAEHIKTGFPIVYTSADSVFQIAAHEEHFGLDRLYEICQIARDLLDPYGLGRVIARPFVGEEGAYKRTYNRRDYSMLPPCETSMDRLKAAGIPVVGVGKIEDIFAGRGVTESIHTEGNKDGMEHVIAQAKTLESGFVFCNLVDFDMLYGHRRDPQGYGRALEAFDVQCRELETHLRLDDLVILTADHGNDPTNDKNTDHTREYVPVIAFGPKANAAVDLGTRSTFADIGATVEDAFGLEAAPVGTSFLKELAAAH